MSNDSPAAILFDELGNPVGVTFDGTFYRLQTQGTIVDGYGNGPVAVKPPNTLAEKNDSALVVAVSPNNSSVVVPTVSAGNSTTTPLSSGTTFTGIPEDVSIFVSIDVTILLMYQVQQMDYYLSGRKIISPSIIVNLSAFQPMWDSFTHWPPELNILEPHIPMGP